MLRKGTFRNVKSLIFEQEFELAFKIYVYDLSIYLFGCLCRYVYKLQWLEYVETDEYTAMRTWKMEESVHRKKGMRERDV